MHKKHHRLLVEMAGGVALWYIAYLYTMAGAEFILSVPSVWLIGELIMPRKDIEK